MKKEKKKGSMEGKEKSVSRRTFLKKSATVIGAAAAGVAFPYGNIHAAAKKPIRIGGLCNITGVQSIYGVGEKRSAEAAVKRVNEMGGIAGRPVEYIMEDAATNVQTAIRKMRKLIMQDNCEFVLGPCNSGIDISNAPIAKSLNTIYFAFGTALSITAEKGNRHVFRGINNVRQSMIAIGKVAVEQLGKRYFCFAADYEWGRSMTEETKRIFNSKGGILVGEIYSPLGTEDYMPYLNKMDPKQVDVLIVGYYANDLAKFAKQADERGMLKNLNIIGGVVPAGIGPKDFGPPGERMWFTGYGPHRMANIPENLRAFNKPYRDAINIDDEGKYKDLGEIGTPSYSWVPWEDVFWIKRGVEKSGWQSREDNAKFMAALEGMSVTAGYDFIQGSKTMRAQDHQAFTDIYAIKIENGNYVVKAIVKPENLYYEPTADFTKEKV
jgi:branched-chain amino acid transport system substrate-binding protein